MAQLRHTALCGIARCHRYHVWLFLKTYLPTYRQTYLQTYISSPICFVATPKHDNSYRTRILFSKFITRHEFGIHKFLPEKNLAPKYHYPTWTLSTLVFLQILCDNANNSELQKNSELSDWGGRFKPYWEFFVSYLWPLPLVLKMLVIILIMVVTLILV